MKILFLLRYASNGGSSRYRFIQFFDYFKEQKVDISAQSFFNEEYLIKKYSGGKMSVFYLFGRYLLRFFQIFKIKQFDLIVVEGEIFPNLPIIFEKIFYLFNKNWIADYDDAVYVPYQNKLFLKNKISGIIKLSKSVIVANENLYNYAKKYNKNVYLIPDALDAKKYLLKSDYSDYGKIIIGWTGNQTTMKFLHVISDCLREVSKEKSIILRCIGINNFKIIGVDVENIKWEESKEPSIIRDFDIGIMPLTDDSFSRGKSGLKIIQYFAAGVPVVASPVGWNKNIIKNGENGFLADSESEWLKYFRMLIKDSELRKRIGMAGRKTFEEKFTLEKNAPKLLEVHSENKRLNG